MRDCSLSPRGRAAGQEGSVPVSRCTVPLSRCTTRPAAARLPAETCRASSAPAVCGRCVSPTPIVARSWASAAGRASGAGGSSPGSALPCADRIPSQHDARPLTPGRVEPGTRSGPATSAFGRRPARQRVPSTKGIGAVEVRQTTRSASVASTRPRRSFARAQGGQTPLTVRPTGALWGSRSRPGPVTCDARRSTLQA